jgi:hypothetical protein
MQLAYIELKEKWELRAKVAYENMKFKPAYNELPYINDVYLFTAAT